MLKKSAGVLVYKFLDNIILFLLVHPGGPFYRKKDNGVWSIPKGEFNVNENPIDAAKREFKEEIGTEINGHFLELHPIKSKSGKTIYSWAVESNIDVKLFKSNKFSLEWPPASGKVEEFPEIDKAEWFTYKEVLIRINESQIKIIDELIVKLKISTLNLYPVDSNKLGEQLGLF